MVLYSPKKVLGRTACICGGSIRFAAGGVKVKVAVATSMFAALKPATKMVHWTAAPTVPWAVGETQPNQKSKRSKEVTFEPA